MRPRVVLMVSTLDGSGPGRVMSILARKLAERGGESMLVATHGPRDSTLVRETTAAGITVANLGMRSMWDPAGASRLRSLLHRWRPDVIHTRTIRADLLGRLAASQGIAVITNIVNIYPEDCLVRLGPVVGRAVMFLARATRSATRFFVANAHAVAANTISAFGVAGDRVSVVYDGLLLDQWRARSPADLSSYGVADTDLVCLTVARLHPQKGLEDLVEAAAQVARHHPDVRFVVAGEGPQRQSLVRQISSAGMDRNVILLGNRDDVPRLLARADLFVLPSRFEGLPSAIIEAMAAGRAVVATATAGVPELVEPGSTGWLVPPACPDALGLALLEALSTDLVTVGKAGLHRAERRFSAAAMTRGFEDIYLAAVGE